MSASDWIQEILDHFKIQEMCAEAVHIKLYTLKFALITLRPRKCVMKQLKGSYIHWNMCLSSIEMCERAVEGMSFALGYVPDQFKTQEMCAKAVCKKPYPR